MSVTLIAVTTKAAEINSSTAANLLRLHLRLKQQLAATRNGGLGFSAFYFILTHALAINALTSCAAGINTVRIDLLRDAYFSSKNFLENELEQLKDEDKTYAITGGYDEGVLSNFRRTLRAVVTATGAELGRRKDASAPATATAVPAEPEPQLQLVLTGPHADDTMWEAEIVKGLFGE